MTPCCPLGFVGRGLLLAVLLLIALLASQGAAFSQSSIATLSGIVTDPNNAVVPGAHVTATNNGTGLKREATTSGSGTFTIPLLPPSTYTVLIENQGFTPAEIKDVTLNVGDNVSLNIQLKVGQVGATIDVESDLPLINESPAVGTVVDRQFVANLPLNGRSFHTLIQLTPGTVLTKTNAGEQGQFSVNGQRQNANYFMVDGVSANFGVSAAASPNQQSGGSLPAVSALGSLSNLVSVDATQEFKVLTSSYAPEFGRTTGAQVSIVTRSGTNQYHGTLFEYIRNEKLDANNWFSNSLGLKKAPLRQNDFGGVFGGRIVKNRAFFFVSYEGLRLRLPTTTTVDVPSLAARQAAVPQIQPFLNAFPVPTGPAAKDSSGNPTGSAPFSASYSDPATLDATSFRIDYAPSSKLTIFGRYSYSPSVTSGRSFNLNTIVSARLKTQTLTAGIYQSLTPRLFNDLRVNWSKGEGNSFIRIDNFGGAVPPADSSLFPSFASSENSHFIFSISDNGALFRVGRNVDNFQRQVNLVDNLSIARGRHQVKVGVDYRRLSPTYGPLNYSQSVSFNFAGTKTGVARTVTIAANDTVGVLFTNLSAFIQDTWNLNSRLTVTYGLRWEHNPPPTGAGGKPLFTVQGLDNPLTMTLAPQGTPLWKTTYHDFAPRVGAAYQLFRRSGRETLLRGGLGVFYDLGNGQAANGSGFAFPNSRSVVLRSVPFPLDPSLVVAPPFTLSPPFNGTIYAFDPNLKLPLVYQWNVAIEQSLGRQQSVSASYVGAAGRRLLRQELLLNATSVNVINPIFSFVLASRNAATSDYDAFQLQYQRRLSRGLQVLGSYTWSHSIDSASSDSAQLAPISKIDPNTDRGPSDFDVRHSFTAAFSYDLPMPKLDRVSTALLRNWSVETIASARTALPVNIITGQDPLGTGLLSSQGVARPDLLLGVPLYIQDPNVPAGRRFNKAAFSVPTTARQGNLGRNALRGFPFSQVDFALRRQFNLTEHKNLQLRAELFNILNHPNFASPSGRLSSSVFGVSTSTLAGSLGAGGTAGGLNPLYQVGGPRSIQFALKLQF